MKCVHCKVKLFTTLTLDDFKRIRSRFGWSYCVGPIENYLYKTINLTSNRDVIDIISDFAICVPNSITRCEILSLQDYSTTVYYYGNKPFCNMTYVK